MSTNLRLYHLALIKLYEDFEDETARELVQLAWKGLSDDEKDLLRLNCNAEVSEILFDE